MESSLPGRKGAWGGTAKDNRLFINAVFRILRTGAPWRDLPPDYGDWKNTRRRFCRWRDKGIWEALLEQLVTEPDYEWLMIDASHVKVHPTPLAGYCDSVCQKHRVILSRRTNAMYRHLGGYLMTTLSRLVPTRVDLRVKL